MLAPYTPCGFLYFRCIMDKCITMSKRTKDLTGMKFGEWEVLSFESYKNKRAHWLCKCSCGVIKVVNGKNLTYGYTKSCGCGVAERNKKIFTKHGARAKENEKTERLYGIWKNMNCRCSKSLSRSNPIYNRYIGRGITVCDEWKHNYLAFKEWALSNGYEEHLTIDRINNDGNYEPSNCRWITIQEQARNRRTNVFLEYDGKKYVLKDLAKLFGIDRNTLKYHLFVKGRTIEETLRVIHKRKKKVV